MGKKYIVRKLHITTDDEHVAVEDYEKLISQTQLKSYIHTCVFESIQHAYKNKRKVAKVIELGSTRAILQIEKEHWVPALENMLRTYEGEEDYERCGVIQKLIDYII